MTGYKILSHDWCAPLQGGPAVCDGHLPVTLPTVALDRSNADCGAGWNFCDSLVDAAKIAGFWRDGRPAVGIREAYHAGLGLTFPTGPRELGYSLDVDG